MNLKKTIFIFLMIILFIQFFVPSVVMHSATAARNKNINKSLFVSPAVGPEFFKINYFNEFSVFVPTSFGLIETFEKANYELESVIEGKSFVPRIYVSKLPNDIDKLRSINKRKSLFIKILLPLILQVNEKIEDDRELIKSLEYKHNNGIKISSSELVWLQNKSYLYDLEIYNFKELMFWHDIIPPSLALAQSIIESGWGTSRFARNGNAVFGQWTYKSGTGLIPLGRSKGEFHEIKSFKKLEESVEQYVFNLNYNRAYKNLRERRENMRSQGKVIDSYNLAETLQNYSQKRDNYVKLVKLIMNSNNLKSFDIAKFRDYF